jgi:predicted nucleic acid-binding protein
LNVYVDTPALLRIVLSERGALRSWRHIERPVSSEIIRVERLRTLDRARLRSGLDNEEVAVRRSAMLDQLEAFDRIPLQRAVLARAADPFPTLVRTLDALHLASATFIRVRYGGLRFATHDRELAAAARALGFAGIGT